ncbi:hypothetical protein PMG11_09660 [Penicillium brasilianum]|uniref:Uncharacterized protein n=1 Tax=Penicillium brasilianum TaxID=104259 RepID=A0A0F7TWR8_PENBI|nr:hypothetical protein PMG11_09660 [Penicillium brasilianum]
MAGSPTRDPAERQSRKRRVSQIVPDKSKKKATSLSSTSAEVNSTKSLNMDSNTSKHSAIAELSVTKGLAKANDKAEGPVADTNAKSQAPKSDLMSKTKNNSDKVAGKDKKLDEKEQATTKENDTKGKKGDAKDIKSDTKAKKNIKESKLDTKDKLTKAPATSKADARVELPGLVQPVPSDLEGSPDDDYSESDDFNDSNDSDDSDDSGEALDVDDPSEDSDSKGFFHRDFYAHRDMFEKLKWEDLELMHMSAEERAEEKAKTLRNVQIFIDNSKDKHYHEFHLDYLTGPTNYWTWLVGIEILLRMHQVWPIVCEPSVPLDKYHELYPWYEHMISVAVSLIYGHVSQEIRSQRCFKNGALKRSPTKLMQHLIAHYGQEKC